jgi:hypothetical protein
LQYSDYDGGVVDTIATTPVAFVPQVDATCGIAAYENIEPVGLMADMASEETIIVTIKSDPVQYQPPPDNQVVAQTSTYDNTFDQFTYSRPTWFDIQN